LLLLENAEERDDGDGVEVKDKEPFSKKLSLSSPSSLLFLLGVALRVSSIVVVVIVSSSLRSGSALGGV
jgi:hypothetical protein